MALAADSLSDFGLESTAALLNRGFAGYLVNISFTASRIEQMVKVDSLDLAASRVVLHDGAPVGIGLIARREPTIRLAGMAIVPEARNKGLGRAFIDLLLAAARSRGDQQMVLEVIEQNEPAIRLYEGAGFRKVRRLLGFEGTGTLGPREEGLLEEVQQDSAAAVMLNDGMPDLPWQISGATLAQLTPPCRVFRIEDAWVALLKLDSSQVIIRGLVAERQPGKQGLSVRLLRALMTRYPGKQWSCSALWPEELSGVFLQAGFIPSPLSQWQMVREIT
jgi:ribosomal protein S18 acetylase RimI-like enzyme